MGEVGQHVNDAVGRGFPAADSLPNQYVQAFTAFQGTRTEHAAPLDAARAAASAGAQASPAVVEDLQQAGPAPVNLHEVADAELLLEELDACGVSGWLFRCMPMPYYPTRLAWSLSAALPALQVGLIASLKNEHKHEIVTQVRPPLWERRLPGAGCGGWGGCAALHSPPCLQPLGMPLVQATDTSVAAAHSGIAMCYCRRSLHWAACSTAAPAPPTTCRVTARAL